MVHSENSNRFGHVMSNSEKAHSLFALVVLDDAWGIGKRLSGHTWRSPYFSVVPEAMHKARSGALEGRRSSSFKVQKSFKGP